MDFTIVKNFMDSLTDWVIPGNSIIIRKDGKRVFTYQSGYSDREKGIKMRGDELFNIYSCSKVVTVVSALTLMEKGLFLLNDPLYHYIPEFRDMMIKDSDGKLYPAKNKITLNHLFTMSGGFKYVFPDEFWEKAKKETGGKMDTLSVVKLMANEPIHFEPGTRWEYSFCHDILAAVVEVISGKKFRDYVKDAIFAPLEMNETFYHTEDGGARVAPLYSCREVEKSTPGAKASYGGTKYLFAVRKESNLNHLAFGPEYDSGGAGITTSVSDYSKFAAALANGGVGINGERIIARNTIDLMRTNRIFGSMLNDDYELRAHGYGYGLGVRTLMDKAYSESTSNLGEFGWAGAAGSATIIDPEIGLSVSYCAHMLSPQEDYYLPRLRNVIYTALES